VPVKTQVEQVVFFKTETVFQNAVKPRL